MAETIQGLLVACLSGDLDSEQLPVLVARTEELLANLRARLRLLPLSSSPLRHLPLELQRRLAEDLQARDHFPLKLTCTAMRDVVELLPPPRVATAGTVTKVNGAEDSMARLTWAVATGFKPTSPTTVAMAAEAGRLDAVQFLRSVGCPWDEDTFSFAALEGHKEVLLWAKEHGCEMTAEAFRFAASKGDLVTLQWLHEIGCPWDADAIASAAGVGRIDIIEWLRGVGCPWDETACSSAASLGQLDTLQWLHTHGCPWDWNTTNDCGREDDDSEDSRLACLQFAVEQGCPWVNPDDARDTVLQHAVLSCQEAIFRFAAQSGCPNLEDALDAAVFWNRRKILFWATTEGGFAWPPGAAIQAARNGDLAMLKRAVANGVELHSDCCAWAAQCGNLHMIEYLREKGCPWDEELCSLAALGGQLDMLQYARAKGCPWDEDTCVCAALAGRLDVLEWCRANGAPRASGDAYLAAIRHKQWKAIEWMTTNKFPLPRAQFDTTNLERRIPTDYNRFRKESPRWLGHEEDSSSWL